jgi:uncharacterized protein (TIGR02145 family)
MRTQLTNLRANSIRSLLAATLALAITFTLSCSGGDPDDNGGGGNSGSPPSVTKGKFTDSRDGKSYETVKIGSQTWMAENLNYNAPGSKCYDNSESNCTTYGRLYDWETAKTACPDGWHLPSDAEWTTLENSVGGSSVAGTKLKAKSGWNHNSNGEDTYGFSALPGGYGRFNGDFLLIGDVGLWWSSTVDHASFAYYRNVVYVIADVYKLGNDKSHLYSVRCLQD